MANLHHLDELRCPSGSDSGEVLGGIALLPTFPAANHTSAAAVNCNA